MTRRANTIADQVYSAVRANIMSLKIAPGTAMSEKEISEMLSVSRTPVREAFIRLEKEGLVTIYPQRGTYVSKISIARAKEERFIRESLEASVLEVFMERHSDAAVRQLERNIEDQKRILESGDWDEFMKCDDDFHQVFYEDTGKRLCSDIVRNSNVDYYRLRCLSILLGRGIATLNLDQHIEMLEQVVKGNAKEAHDALQKHTRRVFTELDEMQDKFPQYFKDASTPNMADMMTNLTIR